ncbi:MAG: hypothetical protein EXR72_15565 [Myxococcales bacterium]|nr:hypothetical protein [Myxococcales bacterium]
MKELRSGRRKALVAVAALVLLSGAVAAAVVLVAGEVGGVVRGKGIALAEGWGQQIGRAIQVGQVELDLFPEPSVELHEVVIAAADGEGAGAPPLLRVPSLRMGVALWPLVTSLGREVEVRYLEARGAELSLARGQGGRLSCQDVLDRLAARPLSLIDPPKAAPQRPLGLRGRSGLTDEQRAWLRGITLSRLALVGATVRLRDRERLPLAIERIDAIARDVAIGRPLAITVDGAALAKERNLHLALALEPDREGLPHLRHAEVKLSSVEIAPLLALLSAREGPLAQGAALSADLRFAMPEGPGPLELSGSAGARGVVLRFPSGGGPPTDIEVRAHLAIEPAAGDLLARSVELVVDGMALSASADLRGLRGAAPEVRELDLRSRGITLEKIAALLPPGLLPGGFTLRGPVALHAHGQGSKEGARIDAAVDLGQATLRLPFLDKPAAMPASVELKATVAKAGATIERLALVIGPASLVGEGTMRSPEDLSLRFSFGEVALERLLRLVPPLQRALPPEVHVAGFAGAGGTVERRDGALLARAKVTLREADLRTPGLIVGGGATLVTTLRAAGGSLFVDADVDLTRARIARKDALDKPAGVAMRLRLLADHGTGGSDGRTAPRTVVQRALLDLPGARIEASGELDRGRHRLAVKVPSCDLDLARLATVLPLLGRAGLPPALMSGKVRFSLRLDGDPDDLGAARAHIEGLDLAAAGGRLRGRVEVTGLDRLRKVTFDLAGSGLDLDRLLPGAGARPATKPATAAATAMATGPPDVDGRLQLTDARVRGVPVHGVTTEVSYAKRTVTLRLFQASTLGGTVTATGSAVDLAASPPRLALRLVLAKIDLAALAAMGDGKPGDSVEGHGTIDLHLDGAGATLAELTPHLRGDIRLDLDDLRVRRAQPLTVTVVNPLLARLKTGGKQPRGQGMELRDLHAVLRVEGGQVRTRDPIRFYTDVGSVRIGGRVSLDRAPIIALEGSLDMSPADITAASGGKLAAADPVSIPIKITGAPGSMKVEVIDLAKTTAALAASVMRGRRAERRGKIRDALGLEGGKN